MKLFPCLLMLISLPLLAAKPPKPVDELEQRVTVLESEVADNQAEISANAASIVDMDQRVTTLEAVPTRSKLVVVDANDVVVGEVVKVGDPRSWLVLANLSGQFFFVQMSAYFSDDGVLGIPSSLRFHTDGLCKTTFISVIAPGQNSNMHLFDPALYGFVIGNSAVLVDVSQGPQTISTNSEYFFNNNEGTVCQTSGGIMQGYSAFRVTHSWQSPYRVTVR